MTIRDTGLPELARRNAPAMAMVKPKDPVLRQVATAVDHPADVEHLAARMLATLRTRPNGMALAAPQVGRSVRLVVTDGSSGMPRVAVNPVIVRRFGELVVATEGCLSLPGRRYVVARHPEIELTFEDLDGLSHSSRVGEALPARMWQHEVDHLDGVLLEGRYPAAR